MEEKNTCFNSLAQRLAAIKADVRRLLADRLLQANKIIEERKGVVARRAKNKSACMAAAVESMGNDKAAAAFGAQIGLKFEEAGVPGIRALLEGIFAADLHLGDGRESSKEAWTKAMDERFPMLKCIEEDDPDNYDK